MVYKQERALSSVRTVNSTHNKATTNNNDNAGSTFYDSLLIL